MVLVDVGAAGGAADEFGDGFEDMSSSSSSSCPLVWLPSSKLRSHDSQSDTDGGESSTFTTTLAAASVDVVVVGLR